MKVKVHVDKRYTFEIEGVKHHGFCLTGRWEGMACYSDGKNTVIVNDGPLAAFAEMVLGEVEADVVKISPALVPTPKQNNTIAV